MNVTATSPAPVIIEAPIGPRMRRGTLDRLASRVLPLVLPLAILLLWLVEAREAWLPAQVMPHLDAVLSSLRASVVSGELLANVAKTLLWLLCGYAIGAGLGLVLGVAMGMSDRAKDYLYPTFKAISYVPVLGWLPLWLVLLGVGDWLKIVLVAQASLSPIVFNVYDGVRGVPAPMIEVGRVFRLRRDQMIARIIMPAAFPVVWSGIRFGLTKAWLALVAVELLASTEGLGFMMVNARSLYRLDVMLVAVLAIGVIGLTLDRGLEAIERYVIRYRADPEVNA